MKQKLEGESITAFRSSQGRSLQLPRDWVWTSVDRVAEVQGGIQKQPKRAPKQNSHPFLRVANVLRGRLDLSDVHQIELFGDELDRLRLRRGDLLVVEGNGSPTEIGRMAVWNAEIEGCVHQNHLIRIRPHNEIIPEFVAYYWNSLEGSSSVTEVASSTSGLYTLNVGKIKQLCVPIAPIAEQRRIVAKLDELFSDLDAGVAALERVRANLKRYRAAILKAAVEAQTHRGLAGAAPGYRACVCPPRKRPQRAPPKVGAKPTRQVCPGAQTTAEGLEREKHTACES